MKNPAHLFNEPHLFNKVQQRKPSYRLALCAVVLAAGVIALGAFTRLVDAGLGCPDWPGCYGQLMWPSGAEEISAAERAFPEAPVEMDKTWPEMVHRYFATTLGVFAIALVVVAWRHRGPGQPLKLPLFLLGFVILQGLFGMWTVTLKLWPQVVTAHLLGGFATLSLLWLLTLRLSNSRWQLHASKSELMRGLKSPAMLGLVIVVLQITLGGWTTSNYAALACPDLPTCQSQWLPAMDFASGFNVIQGIGPNYLGGMMDNDARVAIHMSHRIGAILTLLYVGWLSLRLLACSEPVLRRQGRLIGGVLLLQFGLGLSNILFHLPLLTTVSHNVMGALLLLTLVTLNYGLLSAGDKR
ncbi:MAG: COX15/CtaA family protein [Gammaproteobacteria bacterium]|nr:COX15/CtaA family protein [Gammaproteobacteria bacterium]